MYAICARCICIGFIYIALHFACGGMKYIRPFFINGYFEATTNVIVVKASFCQCTGRLQCKITIIITTLSVQLSSR